MRRSSAERSAAHAVDLIAGRRIAAGMDEERIFNDGRWYNTTQAYTIMQQEGLRMSRTTFWRRVSEGAIKWKLRRNFPGKWFKGSDLNRFCLATI